MFVESTGYDGKRNVADLMDHIANECPSYINDDFSFYADMFVEGFENVLHMTNCFYDKNNNYYPIDDIEYTRVNGDVWQPVTKKGNRAVKYDNRFFIDMETRDYKTQYMTYEYIDSGDELMDAFIKLAERETRWNGWDEAQVLLEDGILRFTFSDNARFYMFSVIPYHEALKHGWLGGYERSPYHDELFDLITELFIEYVSENIAVVKKGIRGIDREVLDDYFLAYLKYDHDARTYVFDSIVWKYNVEYEDGESDETMNAILKLFVTTLNGFQKKYAFNVSDSDADGNYTDVDALFDEFVNSVMDA